MKRLFLISILLLLVGLFFYTRLNQPRPTAPPGYISVLTGGGQLGNQLFDISATLAYAWDHNLTPIFPELNHFGNNRSYNRDKIFFRVDSRTVSPTPLILYKVSNPNYVILPDDLNNTILEGGFFSWRYFDHHRDKILATFAPSDEILSKLNHKYADLIQADNTVAVHVRTYSKKLHEEGLHFVGLNFFEEAISKFPEDSTFVLFSDRILWCKENFCKRFPTKKFIFIEGNDHIEDLYLMSKMKNMILSRSTFSWWGAYLNQNPNKIVYVPVYQETTLYGKLKPYVKRALAFLFGKTYWWDENYWLPGWHVIKYIPEDYPEDINSYGDITASVAERDELAK